MSNFFGTDGIRGVVGKDLSAKDAFRLGKALCALCRRPTVILGQDTRVSSDLLVHAAASGAAEGGATVLLGGILPTAAVSYFVRSRGADFGIVVSASHNPSECNGLKVFNRNGVKPGREEETAIERRFGKSVCVQPHEYGTIRPLQRKREYEDFLCSCAECRLDGKVFVLDCANGAASGIAARVFRRLGAEVIARNCSRNGAKINENCGALYAERLKESVLRFGADGGFCYDGDADRLIALDERGNVLDGDVLLCLLACELNNRGKLVNHTAIGTLHTNSGAERYLRRQGITLLRTDIGDKFVAERMRQTGACIGGEQSGHIILSEYEPTGDGILTSVKIAELAAAKPLSRSAEVHLSPQCNVSVRVSDKNAAMSSKRVQSATRQAEKIAERVLVRASGTEPLIRIFAEAETYAKANAAAETVRAAVISLEK